MQITESLHQDVEFKAYNTCSDWAKRLIDAKVQKIATVFQCVAHFFCYLFSSQYRQAYSWKTKEVIIAPLRDQFDRDFPETTLMRTASFIKKSQSSFASPRRPVSAQASFKYLDGQKLVEKEPLLRSASFRKERKNGLFERPKSAQASIFFELELSQGQIAERLKIFDRLSPASKEYFEKYLAQKLQEKKVDFAREHLQALLQNFSLFSKNLQIELEPHLESLFKDNHVEQEVQAILQRFSIFSSDLQETLKSHIAKKLASGEEDLALQIWRALPASDLKVDFSAANESLMALRGGHFSCLEIGRQQVTEEATAVTAAIDSIGSLEVLALQGFAGLTYTQGHWIEALSGNKGLKKVHFASCSLDSQFREAVCKNHSIRELFLEDVQFEGVSQVEAIKDLLDRKGRGSYDVVRIERVDLQGEILRGLPGNESIKTLIVNGFEVPEGRRRDVVAFLQEQEELKPVAEVKTSASFEESVDPIFAGAAEEKEAVPSQESMEESPLLEDVVGREVITAEAKTSQLVEEIAESDLGLSKLFQEV